MTDDIAAALAREARRRGLSVSAVARDVLGSHLHLVTEPVAKRKLSIIGIGASDGDSSARQLDQALAAEWGDPDFDRGS